MHASGVKPQKHKNLSCASKALNACFHILFNGPVLTSDFRHSFVMFSETWILLPFVAKSGLERNK